MKRRCKESQPSIQSFFSLPSKRRAGEEQICENSQDIARPAAIAAVSADQCDSPEALADISAQEPSVDNEVTTKASLLQDASDGRFTDIRVCWKGLSSGGLLQWSPSPRSLPDNEKVEVINRHVAPGKNFIFPVRVQADGKQRRFQRCWLEEFPWLVYSVKCDAGFCLPCLLFADDDPKLGQLYRSPLNNFTRFKTARHRHVDQNVHKNAMMKYTNFKQTVQQGTVGESDKVQQLVDVSGAQAAHNMEKLRGIVETVVLCGKQNIPLRAHRHEDFQPGQKEKATENPGNFLALLDYRAAAGDELVAKSFHKCPGGGKAIKNTTPRIQNQLVECCGDDIRQQILEEVRQSPFFTVLADEATDASNTEQMPIVLRYLNSEIKISESFVSFTACRNGTTGEALAEQIKSQLRSWGLDMKKLRGQGYDGAANMAGDVQGCAARITAEFPKALYLHCCSHALNLCIMAASKIKAVTAMWTTLREVSFFFNSSPKRQEKLQAVIAEVVADDVKVRKLTDLCRTRWSARHTALTTFLALFESVVQTLDEISSAPRSAWNTNTAGQAGAFLRSLLSFEFIAAFELVYEVMSIIQSLTSSLQEASLDIVRAYSNVEAVHQELMTA